MRAAVEAKATHVVGHRPPAEAADLLVHDDRATGSGDQCRRGETAEPSPDHVHVGGGQRIGVVRGDVHACSTTQLDGP